jgi:hypothetical protein
MVGTLAVAALLLAGVGVVTPQDVPPGRSAPLLRVESSSAKDRRGSTQITGYIYNSGGYNAGNIQLLVVGLDDRGHVVTKNVVPILNTVPPVGRTYFAVKAPAPATTYQVSVYWYEWIARGA